MGAIEERLRLARKYSGLSQDELSKILDISVRSIKRYEKDASSITLVAVTNIARTCGVAELWLMTGHGDMINTENSSNVNNDVISYDNIVEAEHLKLIKQFENKELAKNINSKLIELERLNPDELEDVEGYLDLRISRNKQKKGASHTTWKGTDRRKNRAG